jgi:hypothetical protein
VANTRATRTASRQPGLARRVAPLQQDVPGQALPGERLPQRALRGGIGHRSVQKMPAFPAAVSDGPTPETGGEMAMAATALDHTSSLICGNAT